MEGLKKVGIFPWGGKVGNLILVMYCFPTLGHAQIIDLVPLVDLPEWLLNLPKSIIAQKQAQSSAIPDTIWEKNT